MFVVFITLILNKWQVIANKCVSTGDLEKNHYNFQTKFIQISNSGVAKGKFTGKANLACFQTFY